MVETKHEGFKLKPAVIEPTVFPYVLEGPDMPEVLDAINGVIDSQYNGNDSLKVLELRGEGDERRIVGSNSLIRPVIDEVLPQYRAIRPEELERTLREGDPLKIEGNHYVDYGIVLNFSGNNHEMAVKLFGMLPKELGDLDRLPAVMLDYGLENSEVGGYGVIPVYRDGTEFRTAKILNERTSSFDSEDGELVLSGLPSILGSGERRLYTMGQREPSRDSLGISGFGLGRGLDVVAGGGLAGSSGSGWVVSFKR